MKQFGLRHLYKHLGQAIKLLPFEITNHNRVIAVVISKEEYDELVRIEATHKGAWVDNRKEQDEQEK